MARSSTTINTGVAVEFSSGKSPFRCDSLLAFRGIAALFVVCHHLKVGPTMAALIGIPVLGAFSISGSYTVFIFFCISGFLMAKILDRDYAPPELNRYFRNRAVRILPTYYLAIAFTAVVTGYSITLKDWPLFFLLNNYFPSPLPNAALWSLATECQFYFIAPLIAWMTRRNMAAPLLLLIFGMVVKFIYWFEYDLLPDSVAAAIVYQGLAANLIYFMAGWCAYTYRHLLPTFSSLTGIAIIGIALLAIWLYHFYFIQNTREGLRQSWEWMIAFPIIISAVMLPFLNGMDDGGRLIEQLRQPLGYALTFLGITSYAAYVIHLPVFEAFRAPLLLHLVAVYVLAYCIHVGFERPLYRYRLRSA